MEKYRVTMFEIVDKKPKFYSIYVVCNDVATEIWLNPQYKNVWKIEEIK